MSAANASSNSYESGRITYTSRGATYQSAGSVSAKHYDFLDFLGIAQGLKINFLPIQWQPGLDIAGKGGTAKIRQHLAYTDMTFAFKQMKKTQSPMREVQYMCALIAEISILGQFKNRHHKNIALIEGICWDVDPGEQKVWPVLVFEKAPYGDLNHFMIFGAGRELIMEKRLSFLIDVALAVHDLHSAGIIHGDIKPENVLIFPRTQELNDGLRNDLVSDRIVKLPNEEGCYVARVTDFGFSTLFQTENASIRMPRTKIWTAPEWQEREYLPIQAKKMDAYSFGMLCLWLLFYTSSSSADCDFEKDMENTSTEVLDHALGLIESIAFPELQQRDNIRRLLCLTLPQHPTERTSDFSEILHLLSPTRPPASTDPLKRLSIPQYEFRIYLSLTQLVDAHFEVRNYIVKCLEEKYDRPSAPPYTNLGLALCYELGFGVDRDPVKSRSFLDESGMGPMIFEAMIEGVKKDETVFKFPNSQFGGLLFKGFIPEFNPSQQYREGRRTSAAESQYRREIQSFAYVLGDTHALVQKLRQQLVFLLESEGRWKDAENMQGKMIRFGEGTWISLQGITNLARTYWKQGRYTEAEKAARRSVQESQRIWGEEHPKTQVNYQLLASVLHSKSKWDNEHPKTQANNQLLARELRSGYEIREARDIRYKSAQIIRKIMGENHPDTIASLENQPAQSHSCEQTLRQTLAMWTSVVGKDDPNTLANMDHLAEDLICQGKVKESIEMRQEAYRLRKLHLGEEHPDSLTSKSDLAWAVINESKYEEAEKIQQRALELTEVNLGRENPKLLRRLIERAHMRIYAGRKENATEFEQEIATERKLGAEHQDLWDSMDNVGHELMIRKRYEEAEQVFRRAIMMKEEVLGKESLHVMKSMDGLGFLFFEQANYEEAEKVFRHTSAIKEPILGKDHYSTGHSLAGLVGVLQAQGRYREAKEIAQRVSNLI
ncbi:MAG: hypothetical protein Q9171_006000 [Xanthocarpia ochracea]